VYCWGAAGRVVFAPSKEGLHILRRRGTCTGFKLLGVLFDSTLLMHDACKAIGTDAAWRLRTLLRCRVYHSVASMFHSSLAHLEVPVSPGDLDNPQDLDLLPPRLPMWQG